MKKLIKDKWIELVLILVGLFIAYQLLRILFGGSWQSESLIIALLVFNLGLTLKLNAKFESHKGWHRRKEDQK